MKSLKDKTALIVVQFIYNFLNFLLSAFRGLLFIRKTIPGNVRNILVFRFGNIGDTICAVPAMNVIRENFPEAKIVLLSSPGRPGAAGAKEILENAEFLDGLIIYYPEEIKSLNEKYNFIRKIKKERFDLFIELPANLTGFSAEIRNMVFSKLIGVKYAFGFRINTIRLFAKVQSDYLKFDNEVERLLKILKAEGVAIENISFPLPVSEEDREFVNNFLEKFSNGKIIALNPNAKRETNLWPLERYAELGRWLAADNGNNILIIGGKADKERAARLKQMIGEDAINVAGKFSLLQTIEILRHCSLLISNDTGAVHMASAVGTPVVGIYSAWQLKGKWYPYGKKSIVLRKEPECHTCYLNKCKQLDCLKLIDVNEVLDKAGEVLHKKNLWPNLITAR